MMASFLPFPFRSCYELTIFCMNINNITELHHSSSCIANPNSHAIIPMYVSAVFFIFCFAIHFFGMQCSADQIARAPDSNREGGASTVGGAIGETGPSGELQLQVPIGATGMTGVHCACQCVGGPCKTISQDF